MSIIRKYQRGSALVFAMGLTMLVAVLSSSMLFALHHDMRRYEQLKNLSMIQQGVSGAVAWARSTLTDPKNITVLQPYTFKANDMKVTATLIDLEGLFNLNSLFWDETESEMYSSKAVLERLIMVLGIDGASDLAMTLSDFPQPLEWISELKTLGILTPEGYSLLLPVVHVNHPESRAINIQFIHPAVLGAILSLDITQAQGLLDQGPFEDIQALVDVVNQAKMDISASTLESWIKFESDRFLLHTHIEAKGHTDVYTVLERTEEGNAWKVAYQSVGVRV